MLRKAIAVFGPAISQSIARNPDEVVRWKRRRALIAGSLAALAAPLLARAQPAGKTPRIGILRPTSPPDPLVDAFLQGLRELGYAEGRNIIIEYRWAAGKTERLPELAADLVSLKVDVIHAGGAAIAAKQATHVIPIVFPTAGDPVKLGLVASLARPGGNITGLTSQSSELAGKWMELVKEALPRVARVAVLWDRAGDAGQLAGSEAAARSLGIRVQALRVGRPDEFENAFAEAQAYRAEALIILGSPLFYAYRTRLVELAGKHRLPTIVDTREYIVGLGGFMSFGPDLRDQFRRSATYVDKILKGAKPADLPVEQPTKFELVINLKTAKALGLAIPQALLLRADEVIQ